MAHYFIENAVGKNGEYITPHPQKRELTDLLYNHKLSRQTVQFVKTLLEHSYFVTNKNGLRWIQENVPNLCFEYHEITEEEEEKYSEELYIKPGDEI